MVYLRSVCCAFPNYDYDPPHYVHRLLQQLFIMRPKIHGPVNYVEDEEGDREANLGDAFQYEGSFSSGPARTRFTFFQLWLYHVRAADCSRSCSLQADMSRGVHD